MQKTITRMEQKLTGRVLSHVVFMLRSSDRAVQVRVRSIANTASSLGYSLGGSGLGSGVQIHVGAPESAHTALRSTLPPTAQVTRCAPFQHVLAPQRRAAMALAKLAPEMEVQRIFVDKRGLDVLLDMLCDEVGARLVGAQG